MDTIFVIVLGTNFKFKAAASTLDKAQRYIIATYPNAQQVDDFTWIRPSGDHVFILESELL